MDGRWTINPFTPQTRRWDGLGFVENFLSEPVPVVPCNEDALQRAVDALLARAMVPVEDAVEIVEAVLRAAGETP